MPGPPSDNPVSPSQTSAACAPHPARPSEPHAASLALHSHTHATYSVGSKWKIRRDMAGFFYSLGTEEVGIGAGIKRHLPDKQDLCLQNDTAHSPTNGNFKLFSQHPKRAAVDCACQMDKDGTGSKENKF